MAELHRRDRRRLADGDRAPGRTPSAARLVAVEVLRRVDAEGAYASAALDAEIGRLRLEGRDAALATEIVYGALRVIPALDQTVASLASRPGTGLDPLTRAVLRASCYQLGHLQRVPSHAVVSDAVSLVEARRGRKLAGFVNAVLRKAADSRPAKRYPPREISMPEWVAAAWKASLDPERLREALLARPLPPPLGLRVNTGRISREQLLLRIRDHAPGALVAPGTFSPLALVVRGAGDPRRLPGYEQGLFAVQEEGAQLVGLLTGTRPGDRVADACAGHGGKTALLASLAGPAGHVTAIDINEDKLDRIPTEMRRQGIPVECVDTVPVDLSVGTGGLEACFDRVLVDAPCSGLGTVHRRPELLLRLRPADIDRLSELQTAILIRAAGLVRPGGYLTYAVCSPLPEEGGNVARSVEERFPGLKRIGLSSSGLSLTADPDGVWRIGPWLGGKGPSSPDVYQVVHWRMA